MIGENWPVVGELLGLGADNVALWQMGLRAVIIYIAAIVLVRIGEKRFLGKYTALDVILGFMLGSVLSRAVTGNAPYFETILGAGLGLVLMHWLFAVFSFHSDRFGDIVKGSDRLLVRDGDIQWDAMQSSHISKHDLLGAVRTSAQLDDLARAKEVRLERSGDLSVIERDSEPRILEITVREGVQTVRLELV
ncbi:MAG: DUF421 domain-containing protein [Chloroflexota bacterium]